MYIIFSDSGSPASIQLLHGKALRDYRLYSQAFWVKIKESSPEETTYLSLTDQTVNYLCKRSIQSDLGPAVAGSGRFYVSQYTAETHRHGCFLYIFLDRCRHYWQCSGFRKDSSLPWLGAGKHQHDDTNLSLRIERHYADMHNDKRNGCSLLLIVIFPLLCRFSIIPFFAAC